MNVTSMKWDVFANFVAGRLKIKNLNNGKELVDFTDLLLLHHDGNGTKDNDL